MRVSEAIYCTSKFMSFEACDTKITSFVSFCPLTRLVCRPYVTKANLNVGPTKARLEFLQRSGLTIVREASDCQHQGAQIRVTMKPLR